MTTFELRHTFLESNDRPRFRAYANRLAGLLGPDGVIRYSPRSPEINPKPGVLVWDVVDEGIDAITSAGLGVHLNPCDIPAHALGYYDANGKWSDHPWEGYRSWFPEGSKQILPSCWNPRAGVFDPQYDPTISPECANPPRVSYTWAWAFGAAVATRYGSRVAYYGIPLNEPDEPLFFPLYYLARKTGDWTAIARMTFDDICLPFAQGVRSVLPNALIEGPESQTFGYTAEMLRYQKELGVRVIDRAAVHDYADAEPFPDGAIDRITRHDGGWLRYMTEVAGWSGPWGVGEVSPGAKDDPFGLLEYLPVMRQLGAQWVTLMMGDAFFKPGTYASGVYEPNDLYRAVAAQMRRIGGGKHRGAKS